MRAKRPPSARIAARNRLNTANLGSDSEDLAPQLSGHKRSAPELSRNTNATSLRAIRGKGRERQRQPTGSSAPHQTTAETQSRNTSSLNQLTIAEEQPSETLDYALARPSDSLHLEGALPPTSARHSTSSSLSRPRSAELAAHPRWRVIHEDMDDSTSLWKWDDDIGDYVLATEEEYLNDLSSRGERPQHFPLVNRPPPHTIITFSAPSSRPEPGIFRSKRNTDGFARGCSPEINIDNVDMGTEGTTFRPPCQGHHRNSASTAGMHELSIHNPARSQYDRHQSTSWVLDTSPEQCLRTDRLLQSMNPGVYAGLNLALEWSTEKNNQAEKAEKGNYGGILARGDLARFAHFISLNRPAFGPDRAELDGRLIAKAARYGGPGYISDAFPLRDQNTFHDEGRKLWDSSLQYFYISSGFPGSDLAKLQNHVDLYFDIRARMALLDFDHSPLHDIVDATRQQAKDLKTLWAIYRELAISKRNLTAAHENRNYFDLLYPFFRDFVYVDEVTRPHVPLQAQKQVVLSATVPSAQQMPSTGATSVSLPPAASLSSQHNTQSSSFSFGQRSTAFVPQPVTPARFLKRYQGFVGLPTSASVVGASLALPSQPPVCPICSSRALHFSWECPIRYARILGESCPGFDTAGNKLPAAWNNSDITVQTRLDWRTYIIRHSLQPARAAPGVVNF